MRIAIVDDIETERALLKMRLERQLNLYGVETEILEFDSSESFLAAEKERHFTVAFLDIYMKGLSGMDAAKEHNIYRSCAGGLSGAGISLSREALFRGRTCRSAY